MTTSCNHCLSHDKKWPIRDNQPPNSHMTHLTMQSWLHWKFNQWWTNSHLGITTSTCCGHESHPRHSMISNPLAQFTLVRPTHTQLSEDTQASQATLWHHLVAERQEVRIKAWATSHPVTVCSHTVYGSKNYCAAQDPLKWSVSRSVQVGFIHVRSV